MRAYILINLTIDKRSAVMKIQAIEGVERADLVFGPVDVLAIVRADDLDQLSNVVGEIAGVDGVNNTVTVIAVSEGG